MLTQTALTLLWKINVANTTLTEYLAFIPYLTSLTSDSKSIFFYISKLQGHASLQYKNKNYTRKVQNKTQTFGNLIRFSARPEHVEKT